VNASAYIRFTTCRKTARFVEGKGAKPIFTGKDANKFFFFLLIKGVSPASLTKQQGSYKVQLQTGYYMLLTNLVSISISFALLSPYYAGGF
jgi:hypothetical protein